MAVNHTSFDFGGSTPSRPTMNYGDTLPWLGVAVCVVVGLRLAFRNGKHLTCPDCKLPIDRPDDIPGALCPTCKLPIPPHRGVDFPRPFR